VHLKSRRRLVMMVSSALLTVACQAALEVAGDRPSVAPHAAEVAGDGTSTAHATDSVTVGPSHGRRSTEPYGARSPDGAADDRTTGTADDRPVERSLRPVIDRAVRDLATRLGVSTDNIAVVLAQRVTWPDEQLGCPVRGDGELGDPQPGARVHLKVDGLLYRYHTGGRRKEPFLCDPAAAKAAERERRIEP
jgi:hypothetical protein